MYDIDLNECPEWVELSTLMNETIPEMENQHFRLSELSKTLREGKVNREIAECLLSVNPNAFDIDEYPLGMFSESLSATNHEVVLKGWGKTLANAAGKFGDMPVKMAALLIAVIIWVFSRIKKLFSGGTSSGGASSSAKKKVARDKGISESEAEDALSQVFDRETEKLGNNNIALYVKGKLKAEDKVIKKCVEAAVDAALKDNKSDVTAYSNLISSAILEGSDYPDAIASIFKNFSNIIVEMIGETGYLAFARPDWKNEEIKPDDGYYRGFVCNLEQNKLSFPAPVVNGRKPMGGDTELSGMSFDNIIHDYVSPYGLLFQRSKKLESLKKVIVSFPGFDAYFKYDGDFFGSGAFSDPNQSFDNLTVSKPSGLTPGSTTKVMAKQASDFWFGDQDTKDRAQRLRHSDADELLNKAKNKLNANLIGFKNGNREHIEGGVFSTKDLTKIDDGLNKLEKYQRLLNVAAKGRGVVYYSEDDSDPRLIEGEHVDRNMSRLRSTVVSVQPLFTLDGDKEILDVDKFIKDSLSYNYAQALNNNMCKELTDIARRLTGAVRNHAVFIQKLDDLLGNDPAITSDV